MRTGILITLVAAVATWLWFALRSNRRVKARLQERLARNPAHSPDSFARAYFPSARSDIARRVHRVFLETAPYDARRAQPDDKLVDDLRFDDVDSMATVEFAIALEKEFEIKLPDSELAKARTLRDLVDLIAARPTG